jgi:hypothetical protein
MSICFSSSVYFIPSLKIIAQDDLQASPSGIWNAVSRPILTHIIVRATIYLSNEFGSRKCFVVFPKTANTSRTEENHPASAEFMWILCTTNP